MTAFLSFADRLLQLFAAAVLLSMAVLTAVDVFMRSVFNHPIPAAFEITETLLALLVFAGIALTTFRGRNITLDMLDTVLPPVMFRLVRVMASLISAGAFAGGAWLLAKRAMRLAREGTTSISLGIPYAPFTWFVAVMLGLVALICLVQAFRRGEALSEEKHDD